ncbi:MAG: transglutaminase, partial [Acidobacteria bacterium]
MPGDLPRWPHVAFATGKSWKEVAARYSGIVDEQVHNADAKSLNEGGTPGRTRDEIVARLVARLHREVRYTGVEFGQASLVPRTPAETLKRKYGDCKDKAALLIATLRAAGIPAYMALLNTAPGEDTEPTLPGMGFNHAIVYAPGEPDLWIDATDEYARVGTLPPADQGRLALVARPQTDQLTRTPEATSADNRTLETREFFLAELGPARVVETSEAWGAIEESYREAYSGPDSKRLRDELESYARGTYLADKLGSFDHSGAEDFSAPFHLHLEMPHAKRGQTGMESAAVALMPAALVSRLPAFLRRDEQDSEESQPPGQAKAGKHRKADMVLLEPYTMELRYRIVPSPGFRLQPLPQSGEQHLGPALLSKEFAQGSDGGVTAKLRFDTVKRRFSPEETDALTAGVR